MEHTTIAVDLAKSVFQVAVSHRVGQVTSEHRLRRSQVLPFFAQQPAATVVLERALGRPCFLIIATPLLLSKGQFQ